MSAEILFLRKQLAFYQEHQIRPRPLTDDVRFSLVLWSRLFDWKEVLVIVKPETLIGWHRKGFKLFIGPDFYNWDLSLRKSFALPFREGVSLQFQADAFNVFNRANWNNPTISNAGATSCSRATVRRPFAMATTVSTAKRFSLFQIPG